MKTVESIHAELDSILDEIRQGRMSEESLEDAMGYLEDSVRTYQREYEEEQGPMSLEEASRILGEGRSSAELIREDRDDR